MTKREFTNVWSAIEEDPARAASLQLRSQLMMEVSDYVKSTGLTQTEVAKQLGITQPRLNDVLKGRIEKCSVDRLVNMLAAVGCTVNLKVSHVA